MAKLIRQVNEHGNCLEYEITENKKFLQIGRQLSNDIRYKDKKVSRFHATIFEFEGDYYLIDHSVNYTFYNPEGPEFDSLDTQVSSVLDTDEINASIREFKKEEKRKEMPKIPGFEIHAYRNDKDIASLLMMIYVPEEARLLASCGRKLTDGGYIRINDKYILQFKDD